MQKYISEQNLNTLLDTLIKQGARVVAPHMNAGTPLYEPIQSAADMVTDQLPRRSGKETFFPLCEDIMSYAKEGQQVQITDIDPARFPATVLVGVRPCDAAAIPVLDAVFSWDYKDEFFLERRKKTTVIGMACTAADDACFCTAVGLSPADTKGSDLFLTPRGRGRLRLRELQRQGRGDDRQPQGTVQRPDNRQSAAAGRAPDRSL